jgi:hypothetical protein
MPAVAAVSRSSVDARSVQAAVTDRADVAIVARSSVGEILTSQFRTDAELALWIANAWTGLTITVVAGSRACAGIVVVAVGAVRQISGHATVGKRARIDRTWITVVARDCILQIADAGVWITREREHRWGICQTVETAALFRPELPAVETAEPKSITELTVAAFLMRVLADRHEDALSTVVTNLA